MKASWAMRCSCCELPAPNVSRLLPEKSPMTASPPSRVCAADDCERKVQYRIDGTGWCSMHGRRVLKNGSPDAVRRVASYAGQACSVDGCAERPRRNGMCPAHSEQFRTWGDPLTRTTKAPDYAGSTRKDGYRMLTMHGHPLADRWGHVLEHRVVLYDKIGPGTHPCHWCERPVTWMARDAEQLDGDHLDFNPSNNSPGNLVPSCDPCNVRRNLDRRWAGPDWIPMACTGCGHAWRSRAKPGHWIHCPACRAQNKVAA